MGATHRFFHWAIDMIYRRCRQISEIEIAQKYAPYLIFTHIIRYFKETIFSIWEGNCDGNFSAEFHTDYGHKLDG